MSDHTCDRKGPPAKVIDESGDEPITAIYATCSVCGKPRVFRKPMAGIKTLVASATRLGKRVGAIRPHLPSTEGWAAVAAFAAAIAAFMSYSQQQQSARDAIRPELILSNWSAQLTEPGKRSTIGIGEIENIGIAPAFNVLILGPTIETLQPGRQWTTTMRVSVVRRGEKAPLDTTISLPVPLARSDPRFQATTFEVQILFSDSAGTRYRTTYEMMIANQQILGAEEVGDGISIRDRHTDLY